ncbi:Translation initiation factor 2 [Ignavibacterium album JCM 16511]|uniref:Translation initiation factor IF-2 n=1 Tax=Ignavibacterium album (strain DSM 19864 / JCM 16511 / NBRC 101810 / Mat9-16) TaxID=945713 RepID=I0AH94_IGNAJ|nr:translation initiation factor IF-2 [Ignavibacterium album]AFH48351.1 Translation initiation factor 2 [Ignavibacterium album JCM 16511]
MAEEKAKKIRIHKLASEINLSTEVLIDFLRKKGHEIKSIQSIVTDEMLHDIQSHFKKEIEKAAQHTKKVEEFKKKFSSKSDKESREKSVSISDEVAVEEPPQEVVITEAQKEEVEAEKISEAEQVEETLNEATQTPQELETVETEKDQTEEPVEQENFVQPKDTAENKVKGLKILGKVDLDEGKKKKKGQKEQKEHKEQKQPQIQQKQKSEEKAELKQPVIIDKTQEEPVKKKKKRPKAKKKASVEPVAEELESSKKKKRVKKFEIDEKDVKAAIKQTLLSMDETVGSIRGSLKRKKKREREAEQERLQELKQLESKKIKVNEFIAVNELANLMNVPVSEVIAKCISMGLMVSINQRLDVETITLVADEFGFEVEFQKEYTADVLEDKPDPEDSLKPRPPVVTIMGHVDHGKTSLLDYIRNTNVVAGEASGITQHIGAYQVELPEGKLITFLDTPGHEAFTAMRARGAQLTDIVVLVVAADDAVMPQTVEALNHAQAANVPIIVAINKIDKPGANPDKIKQQLADRNLLVEDWGGKYQCVELSAKTGKNIDLLLEKILLEAEILDLKANPDRPARGAIVEAELDKGRGVVATVLVQKGTLRIGDPFVAGIYHGRVRAMFDERGNKVKEAPPSTPVQVLGFEGVPQAGDTFVVVESERDAREIALKRQQLKREQDQKQVHHLTLDEIAKQISIGGVKELPLIVKGDVDGSVEALSDSFMKLTNQEVVVRVIHKGVGGISESDVLLAAASNAIIIGFNVRPNLNARKLAETQKVDIRLYSVIYDAINEVKSALEGLLSPVLSEEITATVEVREVFKVPKVGTVAGCYVTDGKIARSNKIRIIRDGIVIHQGEILSLKRFKDDVREVDAGYECGISIVNFNDIKVGDIIEGFKIVETKKTLA